MRGRNIQVLAILAANSMLLLSSTVPSSAMPAANLSAAANGGPICGASVIQAACNGACISKHYRALMKLKAGDEMSWATARALCGCKLR
jgi:hypothetical protein